MSCVNKECLILFLSFIILDLLLIFLPNHTGTTLSVMLHKIIKAHILVPNHKGNECINIYFVSIYDVSCWFFKNMLHMIKESFIYFHFIVSYQHDCVLEIIEGCSHIFLFNGVI